MKIRMKPEKEVKNVELAAETCFTRNSSISPFMYDQINAWTPANGTTWCRIAKVGMQWYVCRWFVANVLKADRKEPRRLSVIVSDVSVCDPVVASIIPRIRGTSAKSVGIE